jgi:hypothetical protein
MSQSFQVFLIFEGKTYTQMVSKNLKCIDLMLMICKRFKLPYIYDGENFTHQFPFYMVTNTKTISYNNFETVEDFNNYYSSQQISTDSSIHVHINFHSKIWNHSLISNI